ncbi:MAG: glycerophosphoryl diester phosphodiesterase membrane domain-containing protein [Rhodospirillales bacterium]|nr:glycerophosphoryl diester phosphodiesterase membrane domain-containing protein [Rhodospirillales bacterium]
MDTPPATPTFRVGPTIRLGLHVIRRRALTIIAVAVIARFLVSQAASGVDTFTAITPGLLLRALGLLLFNYALAIVIVFPLVGIVHNIDGRLLLIGAPIAAFATWASLRWALAFPVLVVEGLSLRDTLRRSWQLTHLQAARLLGLLTLTVLLVLALTLPIAAVASLVLDAFTGPSGNTHDASFTLGTVIGQTTGLVVYAPILTACYHNLRSAGRTENASHGPP